jgi:hypothetical protein
MGDALFLENKSDAVRVKARIALNDVKQREVTQPHLGGLLDRGAFSSFFVPKRKYHSERLSTSVVHRADTISHSPR